MRTAFALTAMTTAFSGGVAVRAEREEDTHGADDRRRGSWITKTGG